MRVCWASLLLLTAPAYAQTLRPAIRSVVPSGGQRGTMVEVTLSGPNLGYATQLLVGAPGIAVTSLKPQVPPANAKNPDGTLVATLQLAPDAPLGRHPLRVMTSVGVSEVGYVVVGEWPQAPEKEPNNTPAQAQALTGPVTILGRSDGGEDVDYYKVHLQRGEQCFVEVAAGSIGSPLEPVLRVLDATGHELAFAASLARPDAQLTFTAPREGDYLLHLRDLRYQGSAAHHYRLTVRTVAAPPPTFPLALTEPFATAFKGITTLTEVEPNDLPATAQRVTPPVLVQGKPTTLTAKKPDFDCFRFTATKGQAFELEVLAARLGSRLDAVLAVLDSTGRELASNDDARGKDPFLVFTAPDNGEFIARVSDLAGHSGDAYAYTLRIAPALPDFKLEFSPDNLSVGPGDRVAVTVTTTRQYGLDDDIALSFGGLPAGLRLLGTPTIAKGQNAVTLFATADPGSAVAGAPFQVTGTARGLTRTAQPLEENYAKNNDQLQRTTRPVPYAVAGVLAAPDLVVSASEKVALKVGQTVEVVVKLTRKPGFTAKVPLVLQGLPAGVTATNPEVPENQSEHKLVLKAEGNAAPGEFRIVLFGRAVVDELRFSEHAALPLLLNLSK